MRFKILLITALILCCQLPGPVAGAAEAPNPAPLRPATESAPIYTTPPDMQPDGALAQPQNEPQAEPQTGGRAEAENAARAGDFRKAAALWRELAEKGDASAMNSYALMLDQGQGVEPDAGMAAHWFAMAAKGGNLAGMSNYGRMLAQGRGMPANPEEGAIWLDIAARQGQPEAQYNLGLLYEHGQGVPRDEAAAAAWYSRAAAQAQPDALARLGHLYRLGKGVGQDAARATLLLHAGAMQGQRQAIAELEAMAREKGGASRAVLFGQNLDETSRPAMREALARAQVGVERENGNFICDIYSVDKAVPGAKSLAACYGPNEQLGFLKIDYPARDAARAQAVVQMVEKRFGEPTAREGDDSRIWNLGSVVVATQYAPAHGLISLMYMVPKVYHLTRSRQ